MCGQSHSFRLNSESCLSANLTPERAAHHSTTRAIRTWRALREQRMPGEAGIRLFGYVHEASGSLINALLYAESQSTHQAGCALSEFAGAAPLPGSCALPLVKHPAPPETNCAAFLVLLVPGKRYGRGHRTTDRDTYTILVSQLR